MTVETRELRVIPTSVEIREGEDGDNPKLEGYAALTNHPIEIMGFTEIIESGAFKGAVRRSDVRLLVNHEGLPLARTTVRSGPGSLRLEEDEAGLRFEAELDKDDPDYGRIEPKLRRGLVDQMSFAFRVDPKDQKWEMEDEKEVRRIKRVSELFDVSLVTYAANPDTTVALRSLEEFRKDAETARDEAAGTGPGGDAESDEDEGDGDSAARERDLEVEEWRARVAGY